MSNYSMSDHTPVGGGGVSPKGNGCSHCQSSWRRVNTGSGNEGLTSRPKNEVRENFLLSLNPGFGLIRILGQGAAGTVPATGINRCRPW